jgi:hypothetical protein
MIVGMLSLSAQSLALLLCFSSPTKDDYQAALAAVETAIDQSNRDPDLAIELLEGALDELEAHRLAMLGDQRALELRSVVQLGLSRAYLFAERERDASTTMDALIRDSQGSAPSVERYGPTISSFYEERLAALKQSGTASIEVSCDVPCHVFVQERQVGQATGPLLLGDYRVVIVATAGDAAPLRAQVLLAEPGKVERVNYVTGHSVPIGSAEPLDRASTSPNKARMLPRWAEVSGVVVGVGLLVTGAVLLAFDGQCPGGADPFFDAPQCPRVYDNLASGAAVAAVGGATLLGFGVVLGIDEVRTRHAPKTAMLSWTVRF